MRKRNPDILVDVCDLFSGSLTAFEDIYGYLSDFEDEELVEYIKDWAKENGTDLVVVMYKFEEIYWKRILPALSMKVLEHKREYFASNQGFPHPSYKDLIIQAVNEEIKSRGH